MNPPGLSGHSDLIERAEFPERCPVCFAAIGVAKIVGKAGSYSLVECMACKIQFWSPFRRIGSSFYEEFYMGRLRNIPPLEPGHKFFLADPYAPKSGRLFDIGCGVGNFMDAARARGFDVTGIDWDRKAIQTGKEVLGLERIFPLSLEEFAERNSGEKFDVVSFFEVLEHQDNPVGFLLQTKELVKPLGYIAMSVPNRDRWQRGLDVTDLPPNHLTRWNSEILTSFLRRHGFEIVSCQEEPIGLRRTAAMLSAALPTGLVRAILGGTPPNTNEVAENPQQARRKWEKQARFGRDRIASILVRCKNYAFLLPALLWLPYLRAKGYPGVYLYCLAQWKG